MILLLLVALNVPNGKPLSGPELEQRTHEIASLLRCPVCQGMSVADSPSTVALDMEQQVREMVGRGYTEQQILAYFEQSYGEFVFLKPRNRLIWILPGVVLLIGVVVVVMTAKRISTANGERPTDNAYIDRVHELVNKQ